MFMNTRFHAGARREICAVLGVLAASLLFARNPVVPELAVATACLFFWRPRPGGLLGLLLLGLAVLPLLAILPASWFGNPAWRVAALGGEVPFTLTPQPWAFLSVWAAYLSGLVFLWGLCGSSDQSPSRLQQRNTDEPFRGREAAATDATGGGEGQRQTAVLVFAVAVSAVLIFARWESGAWRGPQAGFFAALFDTRNQAASFAAIALGRCAVHAVGVRETRGRVAWLLAAVLCATALLVLGSRGGLLAAAAGCLTGWGILLAAQKRGWRTEPRIGANHPLHVAENRGHRHHSHVRRGLQGTPVHLKRTGLLIGTVVVALGGIVVLLAPSAPLLDRLASDGVSGLGFRLAVQADAWRMLAAHPVSGVGLGSFDGAFPFFRSLSAAIWRTVHPESDWLWFACEAGVFAGLLAVGVVVLLAARWVEIAVAGEPLPAAVGLGCLAALTVHGLLDVPAHSGPVLFLAAALAGVGLRGTSPRARPLLVPLLVALSLGGLAFAQIRWTPFARPPEFSADRPLDRLPGRESVEYWMRFRPLDVGIVEVAAHQAIRAGDRTRARRLLARVFVLDPFSPLPAARAMGVLVERGDNALAAECAEALLGRTPPDKRGERLRELLRQASENPSLSQALLGIAPSTATWQAVRIGFLQIPVSRAEFELLIKLAARPDDPGIAENPAARALSAALASGHPDLVEKASSLPALRRAAFRSRAEHAASQGDPATACLILMDNLGPPLDQIDADPIGADAYGLTMKALVAWRAGNFAGARSLLRAAVRQSGAPPLAWYLLGCAESRNAAHEQAWEAFRKFLSAGDRANPPASDADGTP